MLTSKLNRKKTLIMVHSSMQEGLYRYLASCLPDLNVLFNEETHG